MSASASPEPTPSSYLTANSIADIRRKYASFSGGRAPGFIFARLARHLRDRVDRVAEQVAVVELRAAAEGAHRLAQLGLDERVDDDGRAPLHPVDRELQVGDRLDARMADLGELLVGELRLERLDEALSRLAGRIGDHVQLDEAHRAQAYSAA